MFPELLGTDARPDMVLDAFGQLTIPSIREKMIRDLKSADKLWRRPGGAAASLIADGVRGAK